MDDAAKKCWDELIERAATPDYEVYDTVGPSIIQRYLDAELERAAVECEGGIPAILVQSQTPEIEFPIHQLHKAAARIRALKKGN